MPGPVPEKNLVLVGGGHAQVYVLASFAKRPMPGVRLTLLTRDVLTPYSGMLPGYVAGHYTVDQCHVDLTPLAAEAGAQLIHDEAVGFDRDRRQVLRRNGPPIPYDIVSIDIGSTPNQMSVPGADTFATLVKPISSLRARWESIMKRIVVYTGPLRFVTVGGGAAGVEITLAIRHHLRTLAIEWDRDPDLYTYTIVTKGRLLEDHNISVQTRFRRALDEQGITIVEDEAVAEVAKNRVICASGRTLDFDELIWVTEAGGAPWLAGTGLEVDKGGFIVVDSTLRSVSDPRFFAAGDIAAIQGHPRPKAGVFAVRQGPPLAENLRRALVGKELKAYVPQREFLSLITTGGKYAIASRAGWAAEGPLVWWIKDQIDRRWMRRYQRASA